MADKTSADSCHPLKGGSPLKCSSRWVFLGSPQSGNWVPAFPHIGSLEDEVKVKKLLKTLAGFFFNPGHPCSSFFYVHTQNATVDASEQTGEGDGHQITLQHMVHILKQLGSSFLVEKCVPPTVRELRLYGLILRHIESHMSLYLMEEISREDVVPTEVFEHAVKQVGCFLTDNQLNVDESVEESLDDTENDSIDVWNGFTDINCLLKDRMSSISTMSIDEGIVVFEPAMDTGATDTKARVGGHASTDPLIAVKKSDAGRKRWCSDGGLFDFKETVKKRKPSTDALDVDKMGFVPIKSDKKVIAVDERVELLLNILRGLARIARTRSYAPPLPKEMKYYRVVWAHIMFCLGFINGKSRLGKLPDLPAGEQDWVFMFLGHSFESIDSIPDGWKLAITLGAIPDLITLMKVCEDHLSDDFGDQVHVNKDSVVENDSESEGTVQKHVGHGFGTMTVNLDVGKLLPQQGEGKTRAKTRAEYLHDILHILKSINWNGLPTTEEQRFYARILDHVQSSIWMYESEIWTREEYLPSWIAESGSWDLEKQKAQVGIAETMRKCDYVIKGLKIDSDADGSHGTEKTREQCLHEAVLSVEAIESSFLDCLATPQEMSCYQEIQQHMDKGFMRTASPLMARLFRGLHTSSGNPHLQLHHFAFMDHHVKCVLDMERRALKLVDEECRKMLETVFPVIGWEGGEKFIGSFSSDDMAALKALVGEPCCNAWKKPGNQELAILIFDSARMCADRVFERLHHAVDLLRTHTHLMSYEKVMDEVCHVPGVWRACFEYLSD